MAHLLLHEMLAECIALGQPLWGCAWRLREGLPAHVEGRYADATLGIRRGTGSGVVTVGQHLEP